MAKPDWEAIESAYRAGSLSIREIAAKHGVSDTAVRKRANLHGWQRDLTDKVKKATRTKLVHSEVRRTGSQPEVRTDEDIIEQAASEAAEVVLNHRTDLADWRRIANKLRTFLDDVEITEDNHTSIARTITAGVDAQIKLIKGERESYNIDSGDKNTSIDSIADLMDELAKG
ncbi:phage protein [Xenorhabdus mauleonii]|uniref:Phage protein n=1 Tax=Xenorhabdus mauleonii TaxID=351675 RepID=A0A1I3UBE5_9GAMM|nr:hypothetical protein [Xenorhabdus mauleonii]PHM46001.1 phage protein [Xenorhabdus mauleonii]SFJ80844.1 hypothetical protein SAMN05421680_116109 [Xenorhabdus mauleonii]